MLTASSVRRILALAALAALASCAEPSAPTAEVTQSAPPPVSLSSKLIADASVYRSYMSRVTAISPAFAKGDDVASAVRTAAAYQPDQLLRGAIVYGAVAALQDQAFVAGVRTYANDPEQRRKVAYQILGDPAYALSFTGASSAAGLVISALGEDGRKLLVQGREVKQAAYDIQHASWSKADVVGRDDRLMLAKQLSATTSMGEVGETARLQQASTGAAPLGVTGDAAQPPYTPLVVRSLAVAALAALGYATDDHIDQLLPLTVEPATDNCLNMSKLNLYQCLAVAKPHYEDVFCLGVHEMQDTGACLMHGVGLDVPVDPRVLAARAAAHQAAIFKKTKTGTSRP
jgi:hypothetical protein